MPGGAVIGSFPEPEDAERAVERLHRRGLPTEQLAIIRRRADTSSRLRGARADGRGLVVGAVVGAFAGSLLSRLDWAEPRVAWFTLVLLGLVVGALAGALAGAALREPAGAVYDLVAPAEVAPDAARVLREGER